MNTQPKQTAKRRERIDALSDMIGSRRKLRRKRVVDSAIRFAAIAFA